MTRKVWILFLAACPSHHRSTRTSINDIAALDKFTEKNRVWQGHLSGHCRYMMTLCGCCMRHGYQSNDEVSAWYSQTTSKNIITTIAIRVGRLLIPGKFPYTRLSTGGLTWGMSRTTHDETRCQLGAGCILSLISLLALFGRSDGV